MDTSVVLTLAQRDTARAVVYRHIKNEDAAREILEALALDSDENVVIAS
jgi:hypothetical protein